MSDFMSSLRRPQLRTDTIFYPEHGGAIVTPQSMLHFQVKHRIERKRQIVEVLKEGTATATELVNQVYTNLPIQLVPVAARTVLAHLIDLKREGGTSGGATLNTHSKYFLANAS